MGVLNETFGAYLISVVVSAVLLGVTCIQAWYYYTHYQSDPWYFKLMVASVFVLDACHQALVTHVVYTYLVTDFGNQEALGQMIWSVVVPAFFVAFTAFLVQSFLAMRIYKLLLMVGGEKRHVRTWVATTLVMTLVIGELVLTIVGAVKALQFQTFAQLATIRVLTILVNAVAAAGDVLITVLLCSLLQTLRSGLRRSDKMINRLILFSINTGLFTSLFAVGSLTVVWPNTFIFLTFYICIGRLYCNCLLANLNARKSLGGQDDINGISLFINSTQWGTNDDMIEDAARDKPNNISIKIDTRQACVQDEVDSTSKGTHSA